MDPLVSVIPVDHDAAARATYDNGIVARKCGCIIPAAPDLGAGSKGETVDERNARLGRYGPREDGGFNGKNELSPSKAGDKTVVGGKGHDRKRGLSWLYTRELGGFYEEPEGHQS